MLFDLLYKVTFNLKDEKKQGIFEKHWSKAKLEIVITDFISITNAQQSKVSFHESISETLHRISSSNRTKYCRFNQEYDILLWRIMIF